MALQALEDQSRVTIQGGHGPGEAWLIELSQAWSDGPWTLAGKKVGRSWETLSCQEGRPEGKGMRPGSEGENSLTQRHNCCYFLTVCHVQIENTLLFNSEDYGPRSAQVQNWTSATHQLCDLGKVTYLLLTSVSPSVDWGE